MPDTPLSRRIWILIPVLAILAGLADKTFGDGPTKNKPPDPKPDPMQTLARAITAQFHGMKQLTPRGLSVVGEEKDYGVLLTTFGKAAGLPRGLWPHIKITDKNEIHFYGGVLNDPRGWTLFGSVKLQPGKPVAAKDIALIPNFDAVVNGMIMPEPNRRISHFYLGGRPNLQFADGLMTDPSNRHLQQIADMFRNYGDLGSPSTYRELVRESRCINRTMYHQEIGLGHDEVKETLAQIRERREFWGSRPVLAGHKVIVIAGEYGGGSREFFIMPTDKLEEMPFLGPPGIANAKAGFDLAKIHDYRMLKALYKELVGSEGELVWIGENKAAQNCLRMIAEGGYESSKIPKSLLSDLAQALDQTEQVRVVLTATGGTINLKVFGSNSKASLLEVAIVLKQGKAVSAERIFVAEGIDFLSPKELHGKLESTLSKMDRNTVLDFRGTMHEKGLVLSGSSPRQQLLYFRATAQERMVSLEEVLGRLQEGVLKNKTASDMTVTVCIENNAARLGLRAFDRSGLTLPSALRVGCDSWGFQEILIGELPPHLMPILEKGVSSTPITNNDVRRYFIQNPVLPWVNQLKTFTPIMLVSPKDKPLRSNTAVAIE